LGEIAWGSDPGNPDSDGDGVPDGEEATRGSLPGDPTSLPLPPELLVSRTRLDFTFDPQNQQPAAQDLLLLSSTPVEISWTVESDVPWLSVAPVTGETPYVISVEANPAGLSPGIHLGNLTFTALDQHKIVTVVLESEGPRIYLPLVRTRNP